MPQNLFSELDTLTSSHNMESDNRAMAIALELTMLRLNEHDISPTNSLPESLNLSSEPHSPIGCLNSPPHLPSFLHESAEDLRNKKSANMTECVPVPSSEHVAEIVGRQGKIRKALVYLGGWLFKVVLGFELFTLLTYLPTYTYISKKLYLEDCMCFQINITLVLNYCKKASTWLLSVSEFV